MKTFSTWNRNKDESVGGLHKVLVYVRSFNLTIPVSLPAEEKSKENLTTRRTFQIILCCLFFSQDVGINCPFYHFVDAAPDS